MPLVHVRNMNLQLSDNIHLTRELGKMGKKSDPLAVVDNKARVFGVSNLRVVDASSFPLLPPGHPQATVCE